jgi:hypothetical protein
LHCETLFYGPLVVATNSKEQPYTLDHFTLDDLKLLTELNQQLRKSQPSALDLTNYKKCLPEYHPESPALAINHADENLKLQFVQQYFEKNMNKQGYYNLHPAWTDLDVLMNHLDKETFYMYRFKTEMCPHISMKHNYKDCLYFHNPKDYRRKPDFIRYYPENCTNGANCPNTAHCDMSHSLFENLYHPLKYKVNSCDKVVHDMQNAMLYCIRGDRCAFYHDENDRRKIASNGCKLNMTMDETKSSKSNLSTQSLSASKEPQRFVPFSPYEELALDLDVYQRKHARSDYAMHPLPALSQSMRVGLPPHGLIAENSQGSYGFHHNSMMKNRPYPITSRFHAQYNVSPPKKLTHNEMEEKCFADCSDNSKEPIYNNQLFEGNTIPCRQTSYSESSIYMMNRQYGRGPTYPNSGNVQDNRGLNPNTKFGNISPRFESHAIESTTLSSEAMGKKCPSIPETDHIRYLLESEFRNQRRADSLKSPVPPGLSSKFRMEESESDHPRSHKNYAENHHDKLENKFNLRLQRKITEDKEREDLSQYTSDNECEAKQATPVRVRRTKMCVQSTGFVPKHLREAQKPKLSDDIGHQINFDINQLVDSTVNSRKHSEVSEDGQGVYGQN